MLSKNKFIKIMKDLERLKREHDVHERGQGVINIFKSYENLVKENLITLMNDNSGYIEEYFNNNFCGIWVNDTNIAPYHKDLYDLLKKEK